MFYEILLVACLFCEFNTNFFIINFQYSHADIDLIVNGLTFIIGSKLIFSLISEFYFIFLIANDIFESTIS